MPNDSLNLKDLITVKKSDEVDSTGNEGKKEEKELSPLERMKNFKETHTGTIVNNEDITYDNEKKVLKNSVENEENQNSLVEKVAACHLKKESRTNFCWWDNHNSLGRIHSFVCLGR